VFLFMSSLPTYQSQLTFREGWIHSRIAPPYSNMVRGDYHEFVWYQSGTSPLELTIIVGLINPERLDEPRKQRNSEHCFRPVNENDVGRGERRPETPRLTDAIFLLPLRPLVAVRFSHE
jgi:hypothetical protein